LPAPHRLRHFRPQSAAESKREAPAGWAQSKVLKRDPGGTCFDPLTMKHFGIFPGLIFCIFSGLLPVACTKGSGPSGEGPASADTPSVSIRANQTLPGYPHAIDMYIPSNAQAAVIFLHGGGGKKEGFEADLGLKSDSGTTTYTLTSAGQDWLLNEKVMAVFPQGQTLSGYNGWTWNNYVMVSGQNDVAFLQALVASLKADASLPAVSKFYLVGHSNGGMMANRMWCESPTTFDAYGALAGPLPPRTWILPSGIIPARPPRCVLTSGLSGTPIGCCGLWGIWATRCGPWRRFSTWDPLNPGIRHDLL